MMQSNIDGMMANYDQISTEREELLESLADVRTCTDIHTLIKLRTHSEIC